MNWTAGDGERMTGDEGRGDAELMGPQLHLGFGHCNFFRVLRDVYWNSALKLRKGDG